jgi:PAS domain S-box-containing protein
MATWERDDRIGLHVWSDEFYRIFGYRVGEVEPSRSAWLARIHPEDRVAAEAFIRDAERDSKDSGGEFRVIRPDGTMRWIRARCRCPSTYRNQGRSIGLIEDITDDKQHVEMQRVLVAELQHRTRNLMAVVQTIAYQTLDTAKSLADFELRFDRRLAALSRVQSLLSRADTEPITIEALMLMELEAIGADGFGERIVSHGPEVPLRKSAVEMLSLAIHELATNAVKYGALANATGQLSVTWRNEGLRPARRLVVEWVENAISPRAANGARRRGYGRTLIEEALPFSLGAETTFDLKDDTLHCRISLPLTTDETNEIAV